MRRWLVTAALVVLLRPAAAMAQVDGFFTPFVGVTTGGDTTREGTNFGASLAAVHQLFGAEVDLGHSTEFNHLLFEESGVTTLMANFLASGPWRLRPYGVAGVGLIRVRGCDTSACVRAVSRTDLGLDAGVGVMYMFGDLVGVRGDVRYFRYVQNHPDLPRTSGGFFDLWRVTVGATFEWPIDPS